MAAGIAVSDMIGISAASKVVIRFATSDHWD
jgi:hypothetical protein